MKVLYITRPIDPPWDEASKNFTRDLVLANQDVESTILVSKISDDFPENVNQYKIYRSRELNLTTKFDLFKLRAYLKKNRVDVLHFLFTPTFVNSSILRLILPIKKFKTVQTVASINKEVFDKHKKKLLYGDIIITYSKITKRYLQDNGFSNVEHIYPGLDVNKYSPRQISRPGKLKDNGINSDDIVALYPGEYARLGATQLLLDSLDSIVEAFPNFKLIMACRIKSNDDLVVKRKFIKAARRKKLAKHVIHLETIADMPELYNLSDMVVFPVTNMDGKFDVPLSIVEAMSCAKATIVSDLAILKEFSSSGQTIAVKTGSTDDFIATVIRLCKSSDTRKQQGIKGRNFIEEKFAIGQIAKKYEKIYKSL